MSFFEFPHTRTYDSDLGWIIIEIKRILNSNSSMESKLEQIEAYLKTLDVAEEVKDIIMEMVSDGELSLIVTAGNPVQQLNFYNGDLLHRSQTGTLEGFCVANGYLIVTEHTANDQPTTITVYDIATGDLIETVQANILHANSFTYNSQDQKVVCATTGFVYIWDFSQGHLQLERQDEISVHIVAVAYDPTDHVYWCVSAGNTVYTTTDFVTFNAQFPLNFAYGTVQGMGCDGTNLFICYSNQPAANYIYIMTKSGAYAGLYTFSFETYNELEEVDFYNGNMLIGTTNPGYYMDIFKAAYNMEFKPDAFNNNSPSPAYRNVLQTFFVDFGATIWGDGSSAKPFNNIIQAVRKAAASGRNCVIQITGTTQEAITVSGVKLDQIIFEFNNATLNGGISFVNMPLVVLRTVTGSSNTIASITANGAKLKFTSTINITGDLTAYGSNIEGIAPNAARVTGRYFTTSFYKAAIDIPYEAAHNDSPRIWYGNFTIPAMSADETITVNISDILPSYITSNVRAIFFTPKMTPTAQNEYRFGWAEGGQTVSIWSLSARNATTTSVLVFY